MFCSQCGTFVADDASFCQKCGAKIPRPQTQPLQQAIKIGESAAVPPQAPANTAPTNDNDARAVLLERAVAERLQKPIKIEPVAPTKGQIVSSIGAVLMLTLMYLTVIAPAFEGLEFNFGKNGGGFLMITAICYWYLFKRRGYKGWLGGIFGVVSSLGVLVIAAAIGSHVRNSPANALERNPQVAALQKHHPQEYGQIEKDIVAAKARGASPAEIQALVASKILPITYKAIRNTSDGALLEYAQAKTRMFRDVAAKSPDDCALLMAGKGVEAGPAVVARILTGVPEETKTAMSKSLARVIEESGAFDTVLDPKTEARFDVLYEQIDTKLKARGTSAYFLADEKKPAQARCTAGLGIFEEAQNLPAADRTFMLRQLLGSS